MILNRRTLLKGTASFAATGLAMPAVIAQPAPIRIGTTSPFSGPQAVLGVTFDAGIECAVNIANRAGGVLGRQIELIKRDDKGTGVGAVAAAREMFDMDVRLLVGAFQSAENAVGQFVKTGKLNFRDLVTSLLADLAQLAARRFILGPIANALSGVFSGAGGIFANVLHAGGMVGSAGPTRMVPAMAFAAPPRMQSGGMAGLRHAEVPAILQRGERVLSRREAQSYGTGGGVNVTIMARDAESFRQSRTQVAADIARAVSLGRRGM